MTLDLSKPPFMTRERTPMHFVGFGGGGETIWQYPDGEVVRRSANGWVDMCEVYKSLGDIINAPHQPRTAYVTVYADGAHARVIGLVYPSKELAELYAKADKRVVRIVPIELPPEKDNAS